MLNWITNTHLFETYGENGVPLATVRTILKSFEVLSSVVTPVAFMNASKVRRSRTTTPISRQLTDDDSMNGGEDSEITLDAVT